MGTPKGITYEAIYEPDQEKMVKALRILLDYIPCTKSDEDQGEAIATEGEIIA